MPELKRSFLTFSKNGSARSVNIRFSRKSGILIGSALGFFLIFFVVSFVYISSNHFKIIEAEKIFKDNEKLKDKIFSISSEIDSILLKLEQMEKWEDKVRTENNLKTISREIRKMGTGGYPQIDSSFVSIGQSFHRKYNSVLSKLEQIRIKTNFDLETHHDLLEQLALKELLFRNTPSIYPVFGRITDGYGWRKHPISRKRSFHNGLDFANNEGTPVYATADGIVSRTGKRRLIGRYIEIDHKFGYKTKYGHLKTSYFAAGQKVTKGEIIGLLGNTGRSTGAHLHYEVLRYNRNRNPYYYLNKSKQDIILAKK